MPNANMYQTMGLEQQTIDFEPNAMTIQAMMNQEESGYVVRDYLHNLPTNTPTGQPVDAEARSIIAGWCVKIMTVCQYEKETAAVAISHLDRFVASQDGYGILLDRSLFQLAALASVYSAVKIREPQTLGPQLVSQLSNGERSTEEIEKMELRLLQAVQWRVNPPTAMAFVQCHLDLIPQEELDPLSRQALVDLAQYQVDMSLLNYAFVTKKASLVGLAALLNAAESICDDNSLLTTITSLILKCTGIRSESLSTLRTQLYELISTKEGTDSLRCLPILRKPSSGVEMFAKTSGDSFSESPRTVQLS
jgi:hypothetical protein